MDRAPGGTTSSAAYAAIVKEGGDLYLQTPTTTRLIDTGVDPRVAISPDERQLVYAKQGFVQETDLWTVALPDGIPTQLTDWRGSEDRPTFSPDGARLVFVSGFTGVASVYVVDHPGTGIVAREHARQVTNANLGPKRPGFAPKNFVPPPTGTDYAWTGDNLTWNADGLRTVTP